VCASDRVSNLTDAPRGIVANWNRTRSARPRVKGCGALKYHLKYFQSSTPRISSDVSYALFLVSGLARKLNPTPLLVSICTWRNPCVGAKQGARKLPGLRHGQVPFFSQLGGWILQAVA